MILSEFFHKVERAAPLPIREIIYEGETRKGDKPYITIILVNGFCFIDKIEDLQKTFDKFWKQLNA